MDLEHSTLVWFSKSFGLIYLIALSIITVVYAYWPSNKKAFYHAARSVLRNGEASGSSPLRSSPRKCRQNQRIDASVRFVPVPCSR